MKDFIVDFMTFVGLQISRFIQKDEDGWSGANAVYEHEYAERVVKNIHQGDYIDAANLCFLAYWAKARGKVMKP